MKLAHYDFENVFNLSNDVVNVLVVEPQKYFYAYIRELFLQIEGGGGNFCLSQEENTLSLSKYAAIVYDYFAIIPPEKKIAPKLYRSLQEIAESTLLNEYNNIRALIADFYARLNAQSDYPITYDEDSGMPELFKAFNVGLEGEEGFLENLLLYIRVQSSLMNTRLFFFVNLKTVLNNEQLRQFYHEVGLMDVSIFLLENVARPKLEGEVVRIIDNDLCEIIA